MGQTCCGKRDPNAMQGQVTEGYTALKSNKNLDPVRVSIAKLLDKCKSTWNLLTKRLSN